MSRAVAETVLGWKTERHGVALATLVDARRSAPQPIGTKMAVDDSGRVSGAVSGGCVEALVVELAEQVLSLQQPSLQRFGIADEQAWDVGLPCGGEIDVWVEAYHAGTLQEKFFAHAIADQRAVLVTALEGPRPGAKLLVRTDAPAQGTLGSERLDSIARELAERALWTDSSESVTVPELEARLFVDVTAPRPRLLIVGAVDFAAQLAAAARMAGWRPYVIDPRSRFATPERFPEAEEVIAAWPQRAFARLAPLDPATAVAVLTHDPKLDDAALSAALDSEVGYIGAMGSRRAQRQRHARLLELGFTSEQLERVSAPIGLDLGAHSPAETALSIMAEIVALRNGRAGGRLTDTDGRIHSRD